MEHRIGGIMREKELEDELRFLMRQADGGYYPTRVPLSDYLRGAGVSEAQAQPIYDRLIAEQEAVSGPLPRWDSARNQPVPGTPEP
jgi:hypothetical protein